MFFSFISKKNHRNYEVNISGQSEFSNAIEPIRVALVAEQIPYYEAPFLRLCARIKEWKFTAFHLAPAIRVRYDKGYGRIIDRGMDLSSGYDAIHVERPKELAARLDAWRPDVVIVYGYSWPGAARLILCNRLKNLPQINRGTLNYFLDPRRGLKGRLMRPLRDTLLKMFTAHHYGGDYSRKVLLDAGAAPESLFFVPFSVDTPYFLAMADDTGQQEISLALRRELGWSNQEEVVLFIAQHTWVKGPDILLKVFIEWAKDNPRARLLMVGSGQMTGELQALAAARLAPGQYHFTGYVPSAETAPYYLAADLVVCTSRYDTWARMVNEAMLCRRSCVLNMRVAAAGGLVEDGVNGYVVPSPAVESDPAAYVAVIKRHFALPLVERQKMGEAAREKAKEFSYEAHMDEAVAAVRYALEHVRKP